MVFVRESRHLKRDLFIADIQTGTVRRLTYGADNGHPVWSPKAELIVFQRARDLGRDSDVDLWSIRPDGTGLRRLAPTENGMSTVFAPNGRLVAFQGRGGCGREPRSEVELEICLMRPDGSGLRPLFPTFDADATPADQSPVWSPDSRRLVFARVDLDRTGISLYVADADGPSARPLTGRGGGPPAPDPRVRTLVARAAGGGLACGRFRQVRVTSSLEREEGRCRAYAVATFRNPRLRAAWVSARRREPWFAARYVIAGRTWVAWTWRTDLALGLRDMLHGRLQRISLRPPSPTIRWRPCDAKPSSSDCPSPLPARPIPRSPGGPVYSFASDSWDTDETMAWGGLFVVAESAPGTTALTGVVVDGRRTRVPFDPPIAGAQVTLESMNVPGLPVLPARVRITTVTDRQGGFAFIDVPVLSPATCYRTMVSDPRLPSFSFAGPLQPGTQYEQDVELEAGGVDDGEPICFPAPK
jgi:hypothetical protein